MAANLLIRRPWCARSSSTTTNQAIESIARDGFDVVLLDLMMPRVDGWAVLRYMQQHRPDLVPHTIIATAVPERETLRSIRDPVFKVHQKPFEIEQLISDVKAAAGAA